MDSSSHALIDFINRWVCPAVNFCAPDPTNPGSRRIKIRPDMNKTRPKGGLFSSVIFRYF